ncbi:MAG: hypothetical protein U9Q98_06505, partial [Bacteroidota bacterium]|nr:hypothetical protein [Bacteroidota bacterium]
QGNDFLDWAQSLIKKDFVYRIKVGRNESKESSIVLNINNPSSLHPSSLHYAGQVYAGQVLYFDFV